MFFEILLLFFKKKEEKKVFLKNNFDFIVNNYPTICLDRVMSLNFVTQKLKTQRLEEEEDGKITRKNINTTVSYFLYFH